MQQPLGGYTDATSILLCLETIPSYSCNFNRFVVGAIYPRSCGVSCIAQVEKFRPVVETCRNLCCNSLLNIAVSLVSEVRARVLPGPSVSYRDVPYTVERYRSKRLSAHDLLFYGSRTGDPTPKPSPRRGPYRTTVQRALRFRCLSEGVWRG